TVLDVSPAAGVAIRLKDLANIYFDYEDSNYKIKQNGNNAVLLTGYFKDNENILITGKEVEKTIRNYKANLPQDIVFDEVLYQPKDVKYSINNFILNLIEGMLFVILVIFWGMGVRNAIVVSTVIPLTILITFAAMYVLGIKIHQISIAALIIALGMLVDNAIVISDAIQVRIDNEQEKVAACVEGVREVALPVLSSTLTTVGAFIPLLLLPGVAGEYVSSLPQIVILSLTFSYLVALFITPSLAYVFFKKSPAKERLTSLRSFFANSLTKAMDAKRLTIILPSIFLLISILLATKMGLQFFPKADNNILYIDIKTEQNNDLDKTENLSSEIALLLQKEPEILSYTEAIGNSLPKFFATLPLYTPSPDFGQIMCRVNLKEGKRFKTNTQLLDYLQGIIDAEISGGTATVKQLEQGEPIGNPIRIRLTGEDMDYLELAAIQVENQLAEINGAINVGNDFSKKAYEYLVKIDVDKAIHYGITKYDVQRDVNTALSGNRASVFRKANNEYDIIVKGNIYSKEDLENLGISSGFAGHKVILKEIAEVGLKSSIPIIKRHEREREITVFSDVKSGYSPAKIEQELCSKLENLDLEGITVSLDGEKAKIIQYFGDIGILAIFAGFVIFLVLLFEFKDFAKPFVILIAIPLSFIGAIWALFVTRMPLSFTSVLGMVSLMGIVVNNAIVLLDYINTERSKGVPLEIACKTAAEKRFRPIILTTVTTIVALTPLILGGDSLFAPMAISLFGGLLVSTILTLIVVPVVYAAVETRAQRNYEIIKKMVKNQ
ncbi:MAG: efflux RND transporter permease subunit, partial [Bacillota bacterium]